MERRSVATPETTAGYPVIKPRNIGSYFLGALATDPEMREQRDDHGTKYKDDGVTPRKELIVHLLCVEADCTAGSIDQPVDVIPGNVYRVILKGGAWGQWIEATKGKTLQIGDTVRFDWTFAQAYDSRGGKSGGEITSPDEVTRLKGAGKTVGIYGTCQYSDEFGEDVIRKAMDVDDEIKAKKLDADRRAVDDGPFSTPAPAASTAW